MTNRIKSYSSFIILFSAILGVLAGYGQADVGIPRATGKGGAASTFVYDYEALGVNPANLGWEWNREMSIGALNFALSAHSKALNMRSLSQAILNPSKQLTEEQKQEFAEIFTTEDGLNIQSNMLWFGTSVYSENAGGLAINLRDRVAGHVTLNDAIADIAFNGYNSAPYQDSTITSQNLSSVLDGCKLQYFHYREFNIAYGRRIIHIGESDAESIKVYAGVGYKYIWGMGHLDISAEDGSLTAESAIATNFDVNYGLINNFKLSKVNAIFNSAGNGHAWDFGGSLIVDNKLKVSLSVTDMGSVTWDKNVLLANDTTMPAMDSTDNGLQSFALAKEAFKLYGQEGLINFKPGEPFTTNLPAKVRLGGGIKVSKQFEVGMDIVTPLNKANGNLNNPYFAMGFDLKIIGNWVLSGGVAGSKTYGFSVPAGISFSAFTFAEINLATNDILTWLNGNDNPHGSIALGLFRLNLKLSKEPRSKM